jgi:hypothetical protein
MRSPRREPARVERDGIRDAAPARPARRRKRWLRRATAAARSHSPRSVSEPDRAAQQALGGGWETSPTLVGDRFAPHPANDLAIRDRCRHRVRATAPGCDRVRPDLGVPRRQREQRRRSTTWKRPAVGPGDCCFALARPVALAAAFACEHQGRPGDHLRARDFRICHRAATSAPRPRWLLAVQHCHRLGGRRDPRSAGTGRLKRDRRLRRL